MEAESGKKLLYNLGVHTPNGIICRGGWGRRGKDDRNKTHWSRWVKCSISIRVVFLLRWSPFSATLVLNSIERWTGVNTSVRYPQSQIFKLLRSPGIFRGSFKVYKSRALVYSTMYNIYACIENARTVRIYLHISEPGNDKCGSHGHNPAIFRHFNSATRNYIHPCRELFFIRSPA
jgi:hypothetical protein